MCPRRATPSLSVRDPALGPRSRLPHTGGAMGGVGGRQAWRPGLRRYRERQMKRGKASAATTSTCRRCPDQQPCRPALRAGNRDITDTTPREGPRWSEDCPAPRGERTPLTINPSEVPDFPRPPRLNQSTTDTTRVGHPVEVRGLLEPEGRGVRSRGQAPRNVRFPTSSAPDPISYRHHNSDEDSWETLATGQVGTTFGDKWTHPWCL